MIRKVMVLAIACLIPKPAGAPAGAVTSCRSARGRRTVEPNGGRRRRSLVRYLGTSTAAPPITRPGINAASNKAAPASIDSPTVTYSFMATPSRRHHSRGGLGRTRRGFRCGSLFVALSVDLGDDIIGLLVDLRDHLAGLLSHPIGAADRRFEHRAYGAAELRQVFRDQHRCDAEHKTGEQGGFKNNHAGADHDDRCRGCDQLLFALGWILEAVSCLSRMVVSRFAAGRTIGLVRLHGIPPFRARPRRSDATLTSYSHHGALFAR